MADRPARAVPRVGVVGAAVARTRRDPARAFSRRTVLTPHGRRCVRSGATPAGGRGRGRTLAYAWPVGRPTHRIIRRSSGRTDCNLRIAGSILGTITFDEELPLPSCGWPGPAPTGYLLLSSSVRRRIGSAARSLSRAALVFLRV